MFRQDFVSTKKYHPIGMPERAHAHLVHHLHHLHLVLLSRRREPNIQSD
nr:MAG TPA: hypothetical protein [Caudoviricetes sp.]